MINFNLIILRLLLKVTQCYFVWQHVYVTVYVVRLEQHFRIDPIKLAYGPRRPAPLTDQARMPAVLITRPIVTQNSPFLP